MEKRPVQVLLSAEGQADFLDLPAGMKPRIRDILKRLEFWPNVSGIKRLTGEWRGFSRIRSGDWRIMFQEVAPDVLVVRIRHRSEVYED